MKYGTVIRTEVKKRSITLIKDNFERPSLTEVNEANLRWQIDSANEINVGPFLQLILIVKPFRAFLAAAAE